MKQLIHQKYLNIILKLETQYQIQEQFLKDN